VWYQFFNNFNTIRPRTPTPFKSAEKTDNMDDGVNHNKENVPLIRDETNIPVLRDDYVPHDGMSDTNSNVNDVDDSESDYDDEGTAKGRKKFMAKVR
jgi:hypothetical protein